jgi:CRISPR-associated protein Csm2
MPQPNRFQGQGRPDQGRSRERQGGGPPQLPTPNEIRYYKDKEKRILEPALVDEEARKWAESFMELKSTQMRRFYDEFRAIERKIQTGKVEEQQANFERDRALIMMFKAKAVYAEKRRVSPRTFTQFIFDHMASIKELSDFKAFIKVFEAVVAFHRFYARDN